jgi:preprotein translocase subunit YajC
MDGMFLVGSPWAPALAQVNQVQGTAGSAPAESPSAGPAPSGGGGIEQIIFFVALIGIFYFLIIRPQQKRAKKHRDLVTALRPGDRVVTSSGMYGRIVELDSAAALVEFDKNVKIKVLKSFIAAKQQEDPAKDAEAVKDAV